ncbi:hypothetical protein EMIHUDRAFT_447199 [Emiliania huxleyi CCMP1516]|uniref:Uncharacterized protein n=2 Tax=Emiliania huxleyi TaxID=2903 RepID=A0A0D3JTN8_EMIH1|nr:hypothetical protein EMIHUDRAFT_447199 [Emiliania huxleyi CCMP1516]EOD26873.1 hypothetical protein EMIHUDRAFT_447199 [Emiliania huxleyi CCMP1516]|eukprot:XP_005779302.1 hypothetical protein EMIHUDRAFT_447199 [Emiliania huxleyi CCMP1516]
MPQAGRLCREMPMHRARVAWLDRLCARPVEGGGAGDVATLPGAGKRVVRKERPVDWSRRRDPLSPPLQESYAVWLWSSVAWRSLLG